MLRKHKHGEFHREHFHVVTMISNPAMYNSRYDLYWKFKDHMERSNVKLHTVELQLGDRPFMVTEACNPYHTQLRGWDEMWHKENALNIGIANISRVDPSWKYVAWIDADVAFADPSFDWAQESIHQLQVHKVIQMFESAVNLGPNGGVQNVSTSFMSKYVKGGCFHPEMGYSEWHPGFAWAARREFFECEGPGNLYDRAILGAGDRHMALALIGKAGCSFAQGMHSAYAEDILRWQEKCHYTIRRDVGFLKGTLIHAYHGKFRDRKYFDRWKILVNNKYHPHHDIKKPHSGVYHFHDDMSHRYLRLRDEIRLYFRQRNEDNIDMVDP